MTSRQVAPAQAEVAHGPKVAFTVGSTSTIPPDLDALDKVHGKHRGMVLRHGGSPKRAERIAARWVDHRKHSLLSILDPAP